jgi:hypothetical protein
VAGGVGDDEGAVGGGEEAVGDVDRDALLALGPQPVGDLGEIGRAVVRRVRERLELVLEDALGGDEPSVSEARSTSASTTWSAMSAFAS